MMQAAFDRALVFLAWACRPALFLFPLLAIAEMAGYVPSEVTIPFAAMAAIHAAGRKAWLASRCRPVVERVVGWAAARPMAQS